MRARKGQAAQACMDRFDGKPFEIGKRDCARLAAHLLHGCGIKCGPMKGARYTTDFGAVKHLRKQGFADLVEAVDSIGLERIAPARAVAGDLVALPTDDGDAFGCALTVAIGNGRVFGFIEGQGRAIQPKAYVAAWRVP